MKKQKTLREPKSPYEPSDAAIRHLRRPKVEVVSVRRNSEGRIDPYDAGAIKTKRVSN